MNLAHFFARNAKSIRDETAIAFGGTCHLTHSQLGQRMTSLAASWRNRLRPGDRVALIAKNCPEYVEIIAACWWAGLSVVPINVKLHPRELEYIVEDADVGLILVDRHGAANLNTKRPIVEIGAPEYRRWLANDDIAMFEAPSSHMAWLFYTSGTTGRPKGAMITHGNLRAMAYAYFY